VLKKKEISTITVSGNKIEGKKAMRFPPADINCFL